MIPNNTQHVAVQYGCCTFVCSSGSYTLAAVNDVLSVKYEVSNPYDHLCRLPQPGRITCSVVVVCQKSSRIVYFIKVHGASVAVKVIDTHHTRSPLVQGGLEIPVEVSVDSFPCNDTICKMFYYYYFELSRMRYVYTCYKVMCVLNLAIFRPFAKIAKLVATINVFYK